MERKRFSEIFESALAATKDLKSQHFHVFLCLCFGKILYRFNDFPESLRFLRIAQLAITGSMDPGPKAQTYKYMSLCQMALRSYDKAHKYAVKLLKIALIFQLEDVQAFSYDLLGKVYFYLGDIQSAEAYHEKMLNCRKTQEIRNIGVLLKAKFLEKLQNPQRDPPLSSCEEEDLDLLDNLAARKQERGRQLGRDGFQKGFYSHLSKERGDPKESLQAANKAGSQENQGLWRRKSPLREVEQLEAAKKRKKMKEFFYPGREIREGKAIPDSRLGCPFENEA